MPTVQRPRSRRESGPRSGSGAWGLSAPDRQSLLCVVVAFLLTRVLLYVTGAIGIRMGSLGPRGRLEALLGGNLSLLPWVRWDATWYLSIAERGYTFDPHGPSSVAFFPLLPMLIRGLTPVVGNPPIAGLLVANLAALGATLALWRWVRAEADPPAAERAALWLLVYPFSFFLHAVYAESLFFLCATLALAASARGRRLAAGLWGGLAATARPMGVLLAPALAWGLWRDWRGGRPLAARDVIAVLLPGAGLAAYMAYLWLVVGDPLAFWTAHRVGWQVQWRWTVPEWLLEGPGVLMRLVRVHTYTYLAAAVDLVLPAVFALLTVQVFRRLGGVAGVYTSLAVAVAVFFAPESLGREFLAAPPAFAVLGLVRPRGVLAEALRLFSLGLLVLLVYAFATGRFVG